MFKRVLLFVTVVFCFSFTADAEVKSGALTLTPMIGGHIFENNLSLEDSSFWGVGLGYNLTENWAFEGVYTLTDANADDATTTDTEVETIRLDALYHFNPQSKLVPYLAAGLGGIYSDPDSGAERDHLLFNYGIGFKYFILDDLIAFRADVRHLVDFPEPDNSLQYSAGLVFQLGKPSPAVEPVAEPITPVPVAAPAPQDSDADGVIDNQDRCPDTPAGVRVDASGCPLDTDADGIADHLDKCPDTPKGATVDKKGCPLDSDGDGVFDYLDQCPGTPPGVSVDSSGCPTVLTLRINFGHDSSTVAPQYDDEIAKAAQCIDDFPGNIVYIDGHTDNTGSAEYNRKLSVQRAQAVVSRLVEKFNISNERMTARGFGEDKPVADNRTTEGRTLNRRVEVVCGAK